jgi:hypothetical protein
MLSSSGDFPGTLSSILSGEGFDEREHGQSPFVFSGEPAAISYFDAYNFQSSTIDNRRPLLLPKNNLQPVFRNTTGQI